MAEPVFDQHLGLWKCPHCDFMAASKKVVENHIRREHGVKPHFNPSQTQQKLSDKAGVSDNKKPQNDKGHNGKEKSDKGKNGKEKGERWGKFKLGDTKIKVLKRPEITIKDQLGWRYFLTANYVASLHKQRVRVKLVTGEEFEGLLKAKDPYFVALVMNDEKIYINKGHIVWIRALGGGKE